MVARSSSGSTAQASTTARTAKTIASTSSTSWESEYEVLTSSTTSGYDAFWKRAVDYLIRVVKKRRVWWAGGQALRFLTERRKAINYQIDYELELKQVYQYAHFGRSYGDQRRAYRAAQAADGAGHAADRGQPAYGCAGAGRIGCHPGAGTSSQ